MNPIKEVIILSEATEPLIADVISALQFQIPGISILRMRESQNKPVEISSSESVVILVLHFENDRFDNDRILSLRKKCKSPIIVASETLEMDSCLELLNSGIDDVVRFNRHSPDQAVLAVLRRASVIPVKITSKKEARSISEFNAAVLSSISDSIIVKDLDGTIVFWNEGATRLFGYSSDEMVGQSVGKLFSPEVDLAGFNDAKRLLAESERIVLNAEMVRSDGYKLLVETRQSLIRDEHGNPRFIVCLSGDIAKQVETTRTLKESEENLQLIFKSTSQAFILLDTDFKVVMFNESAKDFVLRILNTDLVKGEYYPFYTDNRRKRKFLNRIKRVMNNEVVKFEEKFESDGGSVAYYEMSYLPVLNNRKVISIIASCENKTEKILSKIELLKREQQYRQLIETSMDIIWTINETGKLVYVNKASEVIYGWDPKEIVGTSYLNFVAPEDRARVKEDIKKALLSKEQYYNYQSKLILKDGRVVDVLTHAIVYFEYENGKRRAFLTGTSRDISERVLAEKELNEKNRQLRMLSSYLHSVREEERTHIAREIHDELGQQLTGIKIDLSWINKKFGNQLPELQLKIKEAIQLVDESVKTVRKIASELRPGILDDLGLIPAIEWQCQEFEKRTKISCSFQNKLTDLSISKDVSTGVFRILQEALTNIARHSKATKLKIELTSAEPNCLLLVSDNGIGFTMSNFMNRKTLGLVGMQERANMLNGSLTFYSEPGRGTDIILEFPTILNEVEAL